MSLRNYAPTEISVLLGGFYQLDGFMDGTFVNISKDVAPYQTTRTSDGAVARTYTDDNTYSVSFTLAQSSPANDILTKIYQLDSYTQLGKFPLFIKDRLGTSLFLAPTAWIQQIPDLSYGQEIESREWVLQAAHGTFYVGGNESAFGDIEDAVDALTNGVPALREFL